VALAVAGFWLIGGRQGILLIVARMRRTTPAANQPVAWDQGPGEAPAVRKPNIIVILADDMGFNDITFNGGGVAGGAVPTPQIDSIGRDGVNFPMAYAGNATCSPSRAALMTGRYPTRFGFEFTSAPINFARVVAMNMGNPFHSAIYHSEREKDVPPFTTQGLPTSEITIAKVLAQSGYHTLHLGKWHLGETAEFHPERHGFHESLGFLAGGSMYDDPKSANVVNAKNAFDPVDRFLWAAQPSGVRFNGGPVFKTDGYMTDYLTDQAVVAIEANRNRPFFMYLAYNAPHSPLQATKADYDALPQIGNHSLRVYAAMIRNLDRNIGRVLDAVRAQGLENDTLVIFTSDNGGANYLGLNDLNKPFRGWKATFFEGGLRVPFFMRWPGRLPKGERMPEPVTHFDIYATAAAAAGATLPADRIIDGTDLLPFVDKTASGQPHKALYWRSGNYRAIRVADWKLQVDDTRRKRWLYNLADDPTEQHDLAASNPDKAAELAAALAKIDAEQSKPLWPALIEVPVLIDKPLGRPVAKTDEYIYWSN
jgi:arylsulfatase A-like enzyme